jgi:ASC-1-like (ASCH) protein
MKIEIEIKTEQIQALLEGKKLVYEQVGQPTVVMIPDRYGVFMTYEKFAELRRKIGFETLADTDGFFKEVLGEEMFEKVFKNGLKIKKG